MNKTTKIIAKVMLATTLTLSSLYLFAPWEYFLYYLYPLPDTVEEQLDEAVDQGLDGIVVYIEKKGETPISLASGWHDRKAKTPAKPDALFKIASIGKLYDAAAIAKLVAAGRLSLDSTLASYFPEYVGRIENAEQITLRMMVQHQSGIPNFTDQEGFDWSKNDLNVLGLVLDKPAEFAPGTDYQYSNTNYLLLQMIRDKILGYSSWVYIEDEILKPLGLTNTFVSVNHIDKADLMSGYYVGYGEDFKDLDQGFVASASDVGVFLRALNEGTLFTPAEKEIYASLYEYEHTGWVLGYYSIARYHPDIDTVIIQFVNTNGGETILLSNIVYGRIVKLVTS